jgi:hypothetical protein
MSVAIATLGVVSAMRAPNKHMPMSPVGQALIVVSVAREQRGVQEAGTALTEVAVMPGYVVHIIGAVFVSGRRNASRAGASGMEMPVSGGPASVRGVLGQPEPKEPKAPSATTKAIFFVTNLFITKSSDRSAEQQ